MIDENEFVDELLSSFEKRKKIKNERRIFGIPEPVIKSKAIARIIKEKDGIE
jgi:hypothetical protein